VGALTWERRGRGGWSANAAARGGTAVMKTSKRNNSREEGEERVAEKRGVTVN